MRRASTQGRRWAVWQRQDIRNHHGVLVLRRLRIFQTPWLSLYLHGIEAPDPDRDPHDHPWRWWSLVVRGGYLERLWKWTPQGRRACGQRLRRRWSVAGMPTDRAHRIDSVLPGTVTLVLVGPRVQEWGFWTHAGFCRWDMYAHEGVGPDPFDS